MPIIPKGNEAVRMQPSSPVPIASTTDARIRGEALEKFGSQVAEFGKQQYEMDQSLKYQEGTDKVKNIARQAQAYADQNSAEDGSDYAQKFYEFAQPRVDETLNEYSGSPKLNQKMRSFVEQAKGDVDTVIMIQKSQMLEKHNWNRLDALGDSSANRIRENPLPELVSAEFKSYGSMLDEMVANGGMDAENAAKAKNAYYQKAGTQYIQGLENKKMYGKGLQFLQANQEDPKMFTAMDPDQARQLGFIDGREAANLKDKGEQYKVPVLTKGDKVRLTPELAAIANSMDPNKKAQFIDQLTARAKEDTSMKLSDLSAQINGFEKFAMSGGRYTENDVAKLKQDITLNPNLTVQAKKRAMDSVNSANAIGQQLALVSSTPRAQWEALVNGADVKMNLAAQEAAKYDPRMGDVGTDFAVQANRMQNKETLQRALLQTARLQENDAAEFVIQNDRNIDILYRGTKDNNPQGTAKFVRASLAKQQYLGIPADKQRILTKDEAAGIGSMMLAMPDSESAANYYATLEDKYGQYLPRVMSEVAAANKDMEGFKTAVYAPKETRTGLIDAIKNQGVINESFKKDETLSAQKDSISIAANNALQGFRKAAIGAGNDVSRAGISNTLQAQIELRVKRDMVKNPGADVQTLTKNAYDEIVGATYDIQSSGKSSVIVPKTINNRQMDTGIVASYISVYSKPDNFKDLGVAVPSKYKDPNLFYQELAQSGRWVTNESQTGMKLMQMQPTGVMTPVYDKYQKEIVAQYDDINLKPSKKVIDENKGFLGRLFSGR